MTRETKAARAVAVNVKERRVLSLVLSGMTFDQIANEVGYSDGSGAYKAYKRAMQRTLQPVAAEVRETEVARLDRLLMSWWPRALGVGGNDPSPRAAEMVLRIMQRRAQLLGLDAEGPLTDNRVEVTVNWGRPDPLNQPEPLIIEGESYVVSYE